MSRRLLVIGDVGAAGYHAGDEGLLDTALTELRRRGRHTFMVVSRDAEDTAARHGVAAIGLLGLSSERGAAADAEREARVGAVVDGSATDPTALAIRAAVEGSDALLVAGGGNLCATWPHLLYERVALIRLAALRGLPVVLVGQTIGPVLTDAQRSALTHALGAATFIGVRDEPSLDLVRGMAGGLSPVLQTDDAIALPGEDPVAELPPNYVAVTLHRFTHDPARMDSVRDAIRAIRRTSSLPVVVFPNVGPESEAPEANSDVAVGLQLCELVGDPDVTVAPVLPVRQLAAALRSASAVVSSRLHPIVFGLSGGVPCIGLSSDHYTRIKLDGALRHAGLDGWRVPIAAIETPAFDLLFAELWERRAEITGHLGRVVPAWQTEHAVRWDVAAAVLNGRDGPEVRQPEDRASPALPALPPRLTGIDWLRLFDAHAQESDSELTRAYRGIEEYALDLRLALEERDAEVKDLNARLAALERVLAGTQAEQISLADQLREAELSAHEARRLNGELIAYLAPRDVVALAEQRRIELEAVYGTKLWRWGQVPRRVYHRLRSTGSGRGQQDGSAD